MKNTNVALLVIAVLLATALLAYQQGFFSSTRELTDNGDISINKNPEPLVESNAKPFPEKKEMESIGKSSLGSDINAYHFGTGVNEVLLIGGIHGGYSSNTTILANETIQWLKSNPSLIPKDVSVTVIPNLNPDGLSKIIDLSKSANFSATDITASQDVKISGRFNGNTVDLNRNFDCDWKSQGKWQSKTVSGGAAAFSESESQAIKAYIEAHNPKGVIVFFSAAGGVYASKCGDTNLPETRVLMNTYSKASGYPAHDSFDSYETSGDITNWLATKNIPAISVLLTNHTDTEWNKNQAGISAVLSHFAK